VCLVTSLVGSGGKEDCVARAGRVIFCEAGMREELSLLMDFQPAEGHTQWRDEIQSALECSACSPEDLNRL